MRNGKRKSLGIAAPLAGMVCAFGIAGAAHAVTFAGNGATGFGGALGNGSLSITDTGGNVTFTLNNASAFSGNDVVVYIDSVTGGISNTSTLTDNQDGGRESISAYNSGNPSRDLITFATGFTADYALEFENDTYDGLFSLAPTNNFPFLTGTNPSTTGGPYVVTFLLADLGLTQGQSFKIEADLISTSAYGSNETIGASTSSDGSTAGNNPGFNGSLTFSTANTYTTTAVPEPASLAVICVGGLFLTSRRRSRGV